MENAKFLEVLIKRELEINSIFNNKIMDQRKFDLEDRLVKFACRSLEICDLLPNNKRGQNLEYQLLKSSTSSALIYGEAKLPESKADFIHKVKIVLKELRESRINLRIIIEKPVLVNEKLHFLLKETNELIAIFLKSVGTAKKNIINEKMKKINLKGIILPFLFLISY